MKRILNALLRKAMWPARRFFDPRFAALQNLIAAEVATRTEALELTGRALHELLGRAEEAERALARLTLGFPEIREEWLDRATSGTVEDIDDSLARILNYAASHTGFAAQAHLWFNPPVLVMYAPRHVFLAHVNERICEVPYAFRALAGVGPGARVLDVGATESTLCLSLASLGYQVTAVDPRPNPLTHPLLHVVVGQIDELEEAPFDAVMCVSTIEHIGLAAYEQPGEDGRADLAAMRRIRELTKPGGLLVLTVPYGPAKVDEQSRRYDAAGLEELLGGWLVEDRTFVAHRDPVTWVAADHPPDGGEGEEEAVALVTARRES
ncbi:MAG: methyltransferase domain-containing protein [Actinomycetota bacterium]|nr:methyltransferase domain-containing protein [Actinomycetota bacterium]